MGPNGRVGLKNGYTQPKQAVERILGCIRGTFPIKYLGVVLMINKLKEDWTRIIEKI